MTEFNVRLSNIAKNIRQTFSQTVPKLLITRAGMWGERMFGASGFFGVAVAGSGFDENNIRSTNVSWNTRSA